MAFGEADMSAGALAGVRVLSFGQALAGRECAALLSDLGAEVVTIESVKRAQGPRVRLWQDHPAVYEPSGVEVASLQGTSARGQLGISLDMSNPAARQVALRLAGRADVLIENFSVGVLARWGLDEETLRRECPNLVVVSMPAFGSTGPYRDYVGFGGNMSSYVGLTAIWGLSEGRHNDYIAAVHGAVAAVAGLAQRQRSGQGVYIEVPQVESGAALLGPYMIKVEGADDRPSPQAEPAGFATGVLQGEFRCAGEDSWLAIDIADEDELQRLVGAIGDDLDTASFADGLEPLTARIEVWAKSFTPHQAMRLLQDRGICAGVVQSGADLFYDPQLWARGDIVEVDHPDLGPGFYSQSPLRMSKTPGRYQFRMPRTGEHTHEVVQRWLGISAEEVAALDETGAFA
jgi:crotonobetainyl-CoA:carnitine CoA-transferase CaiB-like acyl-CoA transferase